MILILCTFYTFDMDLQKGVKKGNAMLNCLGLGELSIRFFIGSQRPISNK